MAILMQNIAQIGQGLFLTIILLLNAGVLGFVLGMVLAICRYQGIAQPVIRFFISSMRGTPLILQISIVYFAIPTLTGIRFDILWAGVVAMGFNSAAYFAEIFRAGIESLPKGQFEVAKTLAIPPYFMWKDIILPQVLRHVLPAMTNEVITLLKETSLISTIGGMDLMRQAQLISSEQFTYFLPLCIAGLYYYVLVSLCAILGKYLEKRGSYADNC